MPSAFTQQRWDVLFYRRCTESLCNSGNFVPWLPVRAKVLELLNCLVRLTLITNNL